MNLKNKAALLSVFCLAGLMLMPADTWAGKKAERRELTTRLASKGVLTLREGEKELTYEEYLAVLKKWNDMKADLDAQIAQEEERIASLKAEIEETIRLIEQTIQETYAMLGITQADVDALDEAIARLRQKIDALDTYSAAELQDKEEDIKACETELDSLKKLPAAMLFKQKADLEMLGERLAAIRARKNSYVPPQPEGYMVRSGDWLSKLAEYDDVYGKGNFHLWPKIFRANRDLITSAWRKANSAKYDKPEDLIFPEQVLTIPR